MNCQGLQGKNMVPLNLQSFVKETVWRYYVPAPRLHPLQLFTQLHPPQPATPAENEGGFPDEGKLMEIYRNSKSKKNFAAQLMRHLIPDPQTRTTMNCQGLQGKNMVPIHIQSFVKETVWRYYGTPAAERPDDWKKLRTAIDEMLRKSMNTRYRRRSTTKSCSYEHQQSFLGQPAPSGQPSPSSKRPRTRSRSTPALLPQQEDALLPRQEDAL